MLDSIKHIYLSLIFVSRARAGAYLTPYRALLCLMVSLVESKFVKTLKCRITKSFWAQKITLNIIHLH
jgi:hypothetical protein